MIDRRKFVGLLAGLPAIGRLFGETTKEDKPYVLMWSLNTTTSVMSLQATAGASPSGLCCVMIPVEEYRAVVKARTQARQVALEHYSEMPDDIWISEWGSGMWQVRAQRYLCRGRGKPVS